MKLFQFVSSVLLSGIFFHPIADAQDAYYGIQLANFTYEEDGFPDFEPTAAVFRIGSYGEGIGYETRIGLGLADDSNTVGSFDLDFEINTIFGFYLNVGKQAQSSGFYGLLGFSVIDAEATASIGSVSASASDSESGLSFGFGGSFKLSEDVALNIEYMSYLDEDEFSFSAVSFGTEF